MESIAAVIEGQKNLLSHIERMQAGFNQKPKEAKSKGYTQTMLEDLELNFKTFKDCHEQIMDITPTVHASTFATSSRNETFSAGARLPKIDLPKFSGDYLEWISYRDMFLSLVHNNNSLSKVQKYFYLKGSCVGTPLSLVNEYPAADASYELAWDTLEKRFHNERKLVEQILKKLFSIPTSTGTFHSIKELLDSTRNCLAQLKSLNVDISSWDSILIYLTSQKLDHQTRKEWEQSLKTDSSIPPIKDMLSFLETTFRALESVDDVTEPYFTKVIKEKPFDSRRKKVQAFRTHTATALLDDNCPCCSKRHPLYKCFKFATLSSTEKKKIVSQQRLCRNCLRSGHLHTTCKLNTKCHLCGEPHHTIIHNEFSTISSNQNSSHTIVPNDTVDRPFTNPTTTSTPITNSVSTHLSNLQTNKLYPALLATVKVCIKTENCNIIVKALVDQGSQVSFVSEELSQLLPLQKNKISAEISGIGAKRTFTIKRSVNLILGSLYDENFNLKVTALVIPSVSSYAPRKIVPAEFPDLSKFYLADPQFMVPEKIDLLLGNDVYGDLLLNGMKKLKNSFLLQETYFGWMVSGPTCKTIDGGKITANVCSLEKQLRLFWEQEELLESKSSTNEEQLCEEHFGKTHYRDQSGRYTVHLPFKRLLQGESPPLFTFTDYNALKRFKQLEISFKSRPHFAELYKKFMEEYDSLHHMVKLGEYPEAVPTNAFFLPHHGVLRESSSTTKLRVVFDGSNRKPPQMSLNEELSAGPALQNDLSAIILGWRRHCVAFTADLEKMFRQINVCESHQKFQCILWRDKTNKICVYSLKTVTYGTTSAPYLAIRVLQQLSKDEENRFPLACKTLRSDTYVDDIISGADDFEQAFGLQQQLSLLLKSGGFRLRKWNSNSTQLLQCIPEEDREKKEPFSLQTKNSAKALGLYWDTVNDYFFFIINFTFSETITKSSLLSEAAKLFDPLGWLSPTTILAKITFQELWKIKLDWNDTLPEEIAQRWINYRSKLKYLEKIKIPRWIGCTSTSTTVELHGFSDASKLAFAAVVYARVITTSGKVIVNILQAKTKVAPLKTETIPRLELSAAMLLVKLVAFIKNNTQLKISRTVYWTDSTIVLAWLRNHSTRLEVYVKNRIATIQRLSNVNDWRYVPSSDNPADCASRGILPERLIYNELWFKGPSWLKFESESWPEFPLNFTHSAVLNSNYYKSTKSSNVLQYPEITKKFSRWTTMVRVTAYILRFYNNIKRCLEKTYKVVGFLKTHELAESRILLVKLTQVISFSEEIFCLKSNKPLPVNSKIGKLSPFLDEFNILRVGGRLSNADFPFQTKYPILLSKQNPLSLLIFLEAHIKTLHGSLQLMQSYISRYYWILSARDLAKQIQRKCIVCFKYKTQTCQQLMGNLPAVRVQPTRAFKHSGLDYAGPISIKLSSLRNATTAKGYICLFVCMCTKAVHLEAVTSLNVDAFLAAFRRFISRRGQCTDLYSDCGTNFVGANKELQVLYHRNKLSLPDYLQETLANQGTKWHFIPPASPHFGGLWEAGVKSTKHHLRRIMKDRVLTYEELSTLLAQIESCLNSRPLCQLSTDPADNNVLTPAHFLIGEPTNCIPDEDLLDQPIDRLKRWKKIEHIKQHFWNRWHKEFICRLQARPKWNQVKRNIKIGDIVLLLHEKSIPGQWSLAKVEELHPGADGLVRVVTLYCNKKLIKRPIAKICLLPLNDAKETPND